MSGTGKMSGINGIKDVKGADGAGRRRPVRTAARLMILTAVLAAVLFLLYVSDYYRASGEVREFLSEKAGAAASEVTVRKAYGGLFLDGPGEEIALIFYPGGKVEYTAYVPLLHELSKSGIDCFLPEMPANLTIFEIGRADEIITKAAGDGYSYKHWMIGGHSLGGAAAAMYAADHDLDALVLLAAYPTKPVDEPALELYGSEDGVLDPEKREAGDRFLSEDSRVAIIDGGNHAQFGNYGEQKGDGQALISREEQQRITVQKILEFIQPVLSGKERG